MKKRLLLGVLLVFSFFILNVEAIEFISSEDYTCTETKEYLDWKKLSDQEKKVVFQPIQCQETFTYGLRTKVTKKLGSIGNVDPLTAPKFDLRDYNLLSPVKNQEDTELCWTFATNEIVETNYALHNNGQKIDLSEKHIDYNTVEKFSDDSINPIGYKNRTINSGGTIPMAISYLASGRGPVLENKLPWSTKTATSTNANIKNDYYVNNIKFLAFKSCTGEDSIGMKALKTNLVNYGALFGVTYLQMDMFAPDKVSYYYDGSLDASHAISIVGWDDNYAKEKFEPDAPGNGAWIVKDQYGTEDGYREEGFFYVSYYDKHICTGSLAVNNVTKSSDNNYFHDSGTFDFLSIDKSKYYYKNVFTKKTNKTEILKKVNIFVVPEMKYKIYYSASGNIDDAELLVSGVGEHLEHITFTLGKGIEVSSNFSIIVEYEGLNAGLGKYAYVADKLSFATLTSNYVGKGFYSSDGLQWLDSYTSNDDVKFLPIIKAFTDNDDRKIIVEDVKTSTFTDEEDKVTTVTVELDLTNINSLDDLKINIYNSSNINETSKFSISKEGTKFTIQSKINITKSGEYKFIISTLDGYLSAEGRFLHQGLNDVKVTAINITGRNEVSLGGTLSLVLEILPENASNKGITWATSDRTIATVNNGTVAGIKEGRVTITATAVDGSNISKSFEVNVIDTSKIIVDNKPKSDSPSSSKITATGSETDKNVVDNPHTGLYLSIVVIPILLIAITAVIIIRKKNKFKLS